MGARTNFNFKTESGEMVLYSHWGGDSKKRDLAAALAVAMPRIKMGDTSYALRIVISQLIGDSWDSETGYGLYVGSNGGEEQFDYLGVDFIHGKVEMPDVTVSIPQFIEFYGPNLVAVDAFAAATSDT